MPPKKTPEKRSSAFMLGAQVAALDAVVRGAAPADVKKQLAALGASAPLGIAAGGTGSQGSYPLETQIAALQGANKQLDMSPSPTEMRTFRATYHAVPTNPPDVADQFQAATEQINPLIERAEKALAALRLGVTATLEIDYENSLGWSRFLRFGKIDKEWCLTISSGPSYGNPDTREETRLRAASRELRLLGLSKLPELEALLFEHAKEQVESAVKIISDASFYLDDLEQRAK